MSTPTVHSSRSCYLPFSNLSIQLPSVFPNVIGHMVKRLLRLDVVSHASYASIVRSENRVLERIRSDLIIVYTFQDDFRKAFRVFSTSYFTDIKAQGTPPPSQERTPNGKGPLKSGLFHSIRFVSIIFPPTWEKHSYY